MSDELPQYPSYAPAPRVAAPVTTLHAGFVTVSTSFAPNLTTQHWAWFEAELDGKDEFTRDLPNVGEEALEILDARGLAQVGKSVQPGTLLIGKISPREGEPLSPEEKLLRAIFGE